MNSRTKYNVLIITPSEIVAAGVSEILLRSREFVPCGTLPNLDFYSDAKFGACDVVLVDVAPGLPQGKALDLMHLRSLAKFQHTVRGSNDYADTADYREV